MGTKIELSASSVRANAATQSDADFQAMTKCTALAPGSNHIAASICNAHGCARARVTAFLRERGDARRESPRGMMVE